MNGRLVHLDADPHVAVQKLLPWYVSGRLETAEHAEVQTHLAGCPACRSELEFERTWQAAVRSQAAESDDAEAETDAGWADMRRLVEADRSVRAAEGLDDPPRGVRVMPWYLGGGLPARAWAVPALLSAALAVALVVVVGPTLRPSASVPEGYHALAAPAEDSATAVVRFRPEATEAQIRAGLKASGARLVDGPTVTDAYIVRLPRDRYAAGLAALRGQPAVTLVEALEAAGTP